MKTLVIPRGGREVVSKDPRLKCNKSGYIEDRDKDENKLNQKKY